MIYTENREQAAKIADAALAEMASEAAPPNPQNYSIWYDYLTDRNPALVRYIKRAREKHFKLTAERHRDIYEKFFSLDGSETMPEDWAEKIDAAAGRILEALTAADKETKKYGAALVTFSGNLTEAETKSDIAAIIADILRETRGMNGEIKLLNGQIEESHAEVTELRHQLAATQQEAVTDRLTGLTNRRGFDEALGRMVEESRIQRQPLCLVLADIDHFKKFNDEHGHQIGDQVLRLVGRTLNDGTKGRDLAVRYGGEEFALILPETPLTGAAVLTENLRKTLESRRLARKGSDEGYGVITMSFGVTEYIIGESLESLISRADKLLYKAKEKGRNRVVASMAEPSLRQSA